MSPKGKERLVRRFFAAYHAADRNAIEALMAEDFTFTSPYDDHIDRTAWFERCWPMAGTFTHHDLKAVIGAEDECFVLYEGEAQNGNTFRNTERFTIVNDCIRSVEVFFGLPPGGTPAKP